MKPVIVFVGLDKVGKSTIAEEMAVELGYHYEQFPTRKLSLLRDLAKADRFYIASPPNDAIPLSPWSRMLAHALSHSLTYDIHRTLLETSNAKGLVCDRYWYCNVAYAALYDNSFALRKRIMEVELASSPFFPNHVFLVTNENPNEAIAPLEEGSILEAVNKRMSIFVAYETLLRQLHFKTGLRYSIVHNVFGEEGKEVAKSFIRMKLKEEKLL